MIFPNLKNEWNLAEPLRVVIWILSITPSQLCRMDDRFTSQTMCVFYETWQHEYVNKNTAMSADLQQLHNISQDCDQMMDITPFPRWKEHEEKSKGKIAISWKTSCMISYVNFKRVAGILLYTRHTAVFTIQTKFSVSSGSTCYNFLFAVLSLICQNVGSARFKLYYSIIIYN